jgi:hypothetical protein
MSDESDFEADDCALFAANDMREREQHPRKVRRISSATHARTPLPDCSGDDDDSDGSFEFDDERRDNISQDYYEDEDENEIFCDENYRAARAAAVAEVARKLKERLEVQREGANAALKAFLPNHEDFRKSCGDKLLIGYQRADVFHGSVVPVDDKVCEQLARFYDCELPPNRQKKGFQHINFETLLNTPECRPFLDVCKNVLQPMLKFYRVADMFLVVRRNDTSPMHQDSSTGKDWFDRAHLTGSQYADGARPGLRLLFDVATFRADHATPPNRTMTYTIDGQVVFATQSRFVAMDVNTSGSGNKSNVFHGRGTLSGGDSGITASFDLVLPSVAKRPLHRLPCMLDASDRHIRDFFHGVGVSHPRQPGGRWHQARYGIETLTERVMTAQLRASAAKALEESGKWPMEQRHCWRCGSHSTRKHGEVEKWLNSGGKTLCRDCNDDTVRRSSRNASTTQAAYGASEPPIERLFECPNGCTGCTFEARLKYVPAAEAAAVRAQAATVQLRAHIGDDVPLVLAAPHCHFCGTMLEENARTITDHWNKSLLDCSDPPQQVAICFGCRKQFANKKVRPTRYFECDPACTGCRRPFNEKLNAKAARQRAAAALGGHETPAASDAPHCHACGSSLPGKHSNFLRKGKFNEGDGVWLLHCFACIKQSTKRKKLVRVYECPPECRGCRCLANEEIKEYPK